MIWRIFCRLIHSVKIERQNIVFIGLLVPLCVKVQEPELLFVCQKNDVGRLSG